MAMFRTIWTRMTRSKAHHLPPFLSHSNRDDLTSRIGQTCWINFASLCSACTFGIAVVVGQADSSLVLPLLIAGLGSLLSACLAEFLTSCKPGCRSVYSCFYQSSCEILAFTLGWIWLLSLASSFSAICKVLSFCLDGMLDHELSKFLQDKVPPLLEDLPAFPFVILVVVFSLSGLNHNLWWFVLTTSFAFGTILSAVVLAYSTSMKDLKFDPMEIFHVKTPSELLTQIAMCTTIFLGSHNALRLPIAQIPRRVGNLVGPLNLACLVIVLVFAFTWQVVMKSKPLQTLTFLDSCQSYMFWGFVIASLCLLALEFHQVLTIHVQDMASDGLLFRCMSKKWKPFCGSVPSCWTYLQTSIILSILATAISYKDVMKLASIGPLLINSAVSVMVILQRYRDQDSWLYEPMFQNGEAVREVSRKRSTEFLPRTVSSMSQEETDTESSDKSDTDIDAAVQEYKDKLNVTQINTLKALNAVELSQEPSPASSCRAKWLVFGHICNCLLLGTTMAIGCRIPSIPEAVFITSTTVSLIVSMVFLGLMHRLPQNRTNSLDRHSRCLMRIPLVPWITGASAWLNIPILIHVVVDEWHVVIAWLCLGLVLYLAYGMHQSVAAISFFGASNDSAAQISLRPFPKVKDGCLDLLVQPQKRSKAKILHLR